MKISKELKNKFKTQAFENFYFKSLCELPLLSVFLSSYIQFTKLLHISILVFPTMLGRKIFNTNNFHCCFYFCDLFVLACICLYLCIYIHKITGIICKRVCKLVANWKIHLKLSVVL